MEKQIELYMKKLGITREEAIQLIKDDENDVSVELTAEQKKVVKKMTQGSRKVETEKRTRERKPDDEKREIINTLFNAIVNFGGMPTIVNPEREFTFTLNETTYRITLAKPREKKG